MTQRQCSVLLNLMTMYSCWCPHLAHLCQPNLQSEEFQKPSLISLSLSCLINHHHGLGKESEGQQSGRLANSEVLEVLDAYFSFLLHDEKDVKNLIQVYPSLFGDVPSSLQLYCCLSIITMLEPPLRGLNHDLLVTFQFPERMFFLHRKAALPSHHWWERVEKANLFSLTH